MRGFFIPYILSGMDSMDRAQEVEKPREFSPLEKGVAKLVGKEKSPIQIDLEIAYGGHDTPEDAEYMHLAEKIAQADIVLLEGPGVPVPMQRILGRVSSGETHPSKLNVQNPFHGRILELIHNTKKPFYFWDIGDKDPLFSDFQKIQQNAFLFGQKLIDETPTPEAAIHAFDELMDQFATSQKARDTTALGTLEQRIGKGINERAVLRTKKEVKVLVIYGSAHTALYHGAKRRHPDTTRSFPADPYVFTHVAQAVRMKQFGSVVSEELKRKAVVQVILETYIKDVLPRREDMGTYAVRERKAVDILTRDFNRLYDLHVVRKSAELTERFIRQQLAALIRENEDVQ